MAAYQMGYNAAREYADAERDKLAEEIVDLLSHVYIDSIKYPRIYQTLRIYGRAS